jgi:hypothetical protein
VALHGTSSSYLCDALHEDGAVDVACLHAPRAWASVPLIFYVHSTSSLANFTAFCNQIITMITRNPCCSFLSLVVA